jgi:hypothetical protein
VPIGNGRQHKPWQLQTSELGASALHNRARDSVNRRSKAAPVGSGVASVVIAEAVTDCRGVTPITAQN